MDSTGIDARVGVRFPCRRFLFLTLALLLAQGCGDSPDTSPVVESAAEGPEPFIESAAASGLDFVHFNGMSGELYYPEMMGAGAALFDFDNDGDLDVYLVQGRMLNPGTELGEATFPPTPEMLPLRDRLYRNDLEVDVAGRPRPRFTDVTAASGLAADGYGMGVAAADFDNDGWIDLYVTQLGSNQLWRNLGDGTFRDATASASADDPRWSLSATWVDFDLDGWLDLYVVNYVDFTVADHRQCRMMSGQADYCGPQAFPSVADTLLRNRGAGTDGTVTFEDVSEASGIAAVSGAGMGVAAGDFDGDGRPDLYVANDGMANYLWLGKGDASFVDEAMLSGAAFNREGQAEAGMGVAAGDYDGDGDDDLLLTHLALETHTLYRNEGGGAFEDVTAGSGLGAPSWRATGFGAAWLDYDNDGWLDLLTVNGGVILIPELLAAGDPHPLGMPNLLFHNLGAAGTPIRFEEVESVGDSSRSVAVSRGLAVGDLDNDGDVDAVVTNNAGAVELFLNRVGQERHWLGLRLVGAAGVRAASNTAPRDMLGAEVEVARPQGRPLWRRARSGGSYLSSHDPRLLFGLGEDPKVGPVRVRWPGGSLEEFDVEADRYSTLRQSEGRPVDDGT